MRACYERVAETVCHVVVHVAAYSCPAHPPPAVIVVGVVVDVSILVLCVAMICYSKRFIALAYPASARSLP